MSRASDDGLCPRKSGGTFRDRSRSRSTTTPCGPVSSLELGDFRWTQVANFLVAGLLRLAFAIGMRCAPRPLGGSTWGPLLVGACAIGLLGAGTFLADPLSGYPSGTPDRLL
jgi:hypothetical protein